jgi:MoxR-like ATPase
LENPLETNNPYETQQWQDAETVLNSSINRLVLYGVSGTGKTFSALFSKPADQPVYRIICTEDMNAGQIEGMWYPTANGFEFHEGEAVQAWRNGGRLVIDEVSRASTDVMSLLLLFTDTNTSSNWKNPQTGEVVKPHENFSVVMTMNGEPEDLDPALRDRFSCRVRIDTPHPQAIAMLPAKYQQPAFKMSNRPSDERLSIRAFMDLAKLEQETNLETALRIVCPQQAYAIKTALEVSAMESGQLPV